jgi:hypothetical protein
MRISRKEAVEFYTKLTNLKSGEYNKFLLYAIMKNKIELKKIYEDLIAEERKLSTSPELEKFEQERIEIVSAFARKDETGGPIIENGRYDIPEEMISDVQKKIAELQEKYKDALGKNRKDVETYEKSLLEEIEIQETRTAFKNLPENMTPEIFEILIKLADDPE